MRYVVLHKTVGQTPLEAVKEWQAQYRQYADIPASYAGRLDPMASGKLLVLLGDECKKQGSYTNLDKEYEVEVLFDISSDTGDVLGLAEYASKETRVDTASMRTALHALEGAHVVPYPAFSSKPVNGKPLFLHALEGTLGAIDIPTHTEHIFRIDVLENERVTQAKLVERVRNLLALAPTSDEPSKVLGADFRIDAVRTSWETLFKASGSRDFCVLRLRVTCASGTYMRTLAERLGKHLGTHALALSITRTKIGHYVRLPFRVGIWIKQY